jgi:hypothetical protein
LGLKRLYIWQAAVPFDFFLCAARAGREAKQGNGTTHHAANFINKIFVLCFANELIHHTQFSNFLRDIFIHARAVKHKSWRAWGASFVGGAQNPGTKCESKRLPAKINRAGSVAKFLNMRARALE